MTVAAEQLAVLNPRRLDVDLVAAIPLLPHARGLREGPGTRASAAFGFPAQGEPSGEKNSNLGLPAQGPSSK